MTNEEMARLIQAGRAEWIPILWERVRKLAARLASSYYSRHYGLCRHAGVTDEDLMQEAYFGFIQAVHSYRPESGYLFTTYLHYPLANCFRNAAGQRTAKDRQEPLQHAMSLNTPTGEDDSLTLEDMLEDDTVPESFEQIEITDMQRIVREELARLEDDRQQEAIAAHYLRGQTYQVIADRYGVSLGRARQIIQAGILKLRQSRRLRELYGESKGHGMDFVLHRIMYSPEYFELAQQIREWQKREYISYGRQQAILYQLAQKSLALQEQMDGI